MVPAKALFLFFVCHCTALPFGVRTCCQAHGSSQGAVPVFRLPLHRFAVWSAYLLPFFIKHASDELVRPPVWSGSPWPVETTGHHTSTMTSAESVTACDQ